MIPQLNFSAVRQNAMLDISQTLAHHHKYNTPTVKHDGGNIMLWGRFSAVGPSKLVRIGDKMNATKYREMLEKNLMQSARNLPQEICSKSRKCA